MRVVLSLCDRTGNMVRPWAEAGHQCVIVDLQHPPGESELEPNIVRLGMDVREYMGLYSTILQPSIVFAFPPCTHLASSGAAWFERKGHAALQEGLELVGACREVCTSSGAPWMIENPVGRLTRHWRKYDHKFHPCDYGGYYDPPVDTYLKTTCLWVGGGFRMPARRRVEPTEREWVRSLNSDRANRANQRSVTPVGFARAVYQANSVHVT